MRWLAALYRRARGCPTGWKLTQAATLGTDLRLEIHVRGCRHCAREIRSLRELVAQARAALPEADAMSDAERNEISLHLLTSPSLTPVPNAQPRGWWVATACAAALAVAALVYARYGSGVAHDAARPQRPPIHSLVTVRAIGTARFSRAQSPPDEVVRLDDGSIDLDVVHLRWGERFRVLTSDAEVEVRGTRFRVTASDRRLTSVRVWEGRVEVRPFGGGAAVLDAGDVWEGIPQNDAEDAPNSPFSDSIHADGTRAESADGKPPATISPGRETQLPPHARPGGRAGVTPPDLADRPSGAAPHADPGRRPDAVSSRGNRAFDRAWTLLREGDTANAARAFAEVEALVRGSALEEDALYWRAVATARSKDPRSAPLFSTFLGRFPSSSRAGQAAVALGWIWLDQGKADDAKLMFSRALTDPSPEVVESARAGLRRIDE